MRRTATRCCIVAMLAAVCWAPTAWADTIDFEDLPLAADNHWNGYDSKPHPEDNVGEEHPFTSHGVEFYNYYISGWNNSWGCPYTYWEGWAYSNETDTTTPGYYNQFSAIAGGGVAGSTNYGVFYLPETADPSQDVFRRIDIELAMTDLPDRHGIYVTNTTYAYWSMHDGDQIGRKFGHTWDTENQVWVDTNEPDWFKLIVTGLDAADTPIGGLDPVEFYLADYRNVDGVTDYILDDWTWMDLSGLAEGGAERLRFVLDSSDTGAYGINTPLYVAMDNPTLLPEPSALVLILGAALCGLLWQRRRRGE